MTQAGVIPKYLNGVLRITEEENFHLIEMRPSYKPFTELSTQIANIANKFNLDFQNINQIQKSIKEHEPEEIAHAIEYLFKEKEHTLLIYIDQFEELFTLCEESVQKDFVELLLYFLNYSHKRIKIKIIMTMRRDYYNLISEYEELFGFTQVHKYNLQKMALEQFQCCIEEPLKRTFISKEEIASFSKAVLQDLGEKSSELTLLQIALTQTWLHKQRYNNNLLRTYHEIGEVSGALSNLADNTWNILSPTEKKILKYICIRIIKSSDTGGITRRLAEREDFSDEAWLLTLKSLHSLL